ncbi:Sulfate transport system permease protein CysW [compost metagenome]
MFDGFNLYSWSGLILVYVYFQIPLALLLLYPAFYGIREQWREAAALLGAGSWQFWRTVGLPVLSPAIFGTLGILFANAMGAYATAYALVGGNYNLLAVRIGSLVAGDVVTQPQMGSTLAVLLALSTLLAVFLNQRMVRRMEGLGGRNSAGRERSRGLLRRRWPAVREEAGQ